MVSQDTISKSSFLFFLSLVGRKSISFVYFAVIARYSGQNTTAFFYLIISAWSIFSTLMDFGLSPILIRKLSHNLKKTEVYLGNVLSIKSILCFVGAVSAAFLISILDYPAITRQVLYVVIAGMVMESLSTTFYACLRAYRQSKYEAFGMDTGQAIALVIICLSVWLQVSVFWYITALTISSLFNLFYSYYSLKRLTNLQIRLYATPAIYHFLKAAIPFFFSNIFSRLLLVNTLILSYFTTPAIVAVFSVPSMIINSLYFIPISLMVPLYPTFCRYRSRHSQKKAIALFNNSYILLLSIVLPVSLFFSLFPRVVIQIFGAGYLQSDSIFRLLALSLIPIFLNTLFSTVLNAYYRQKTVMVIVAVSGLLNIGLSILWIPKYQVWGIAYALLLSQVLFLIMSGISLRTVLSISFVRSFFIPFLQIFIPSGLTMAFLYGVYWFLPFYYGIPLLFFAPLIYIPLWLLTLSFFNRQEISFHRLLPFKHVN